ncbi:OmpA family protein [Cupriavidus basilensis]|uniref:Outer membrane lipoprotein omp16 n=1 Tax=Cupriavidus basilensis TaxID=68895 RepID=A0A0C4YGE8_9BURK|nr:OmpA family protein [Cupriavidus basilensis]AJG22018.1 Outer membrane lipoprotein omp16 precursor [Cupriavidus basilensis]
MLSNLQAAGSRCITAAVIAVPLALAACQTVPAPKLTAVQVEALQSQGFQLTENGWELDFSEKVLFGLDEDVISADRQVAVQRIGRALSGAGIDHVRLDGHTDDSGSADYNQQLSVRRAQAVANVLATTGFQAESIQVRGLGKSKPVVDNRTAAGRAENRRVAIVVTIE